MSSSLTQSWKSWRPGTAIALGLCVGVVLGVALGPLGLWIALGVAFGAVGEGALAKARSSR